MNERQRKEALKQAANHASPWVANLLRSVAEEPEPRTFNRAPAPSGRMTQLELFTKERT